MSFTRYGEKKKEKLNETNIPLCCMLASFFIPKQLRRLLLTICSPFHGAANRYQRHFVTRNTKKCRMSPVCGLLCCCVLLPALGRTSGTCGTSICSKWISQSPSEIRGKPMGAARVRVEGAHPQQNNTTSAENQKHMYTLIAREDFNTRRGTLSDLERIHFSA